MWQHAAILLVIGRVNEASVRTNDASFLDPHAGQQVDGCYL